MGEVQDAGEFIKALKVVLLDVLEKVREQSKLNQTPVARAHLNAKWEMIDVLMLFLNKKEEDMGKLRTDLIKQVVSLSELKPIKKRSELAELIKEAADVLEQRMAEDKKLQTVGASLPAQYIKADINWGHFSAKVAQMRIAGELPPDVTSAKRGAEFYLVKLPKGQAVRARTRRNVRPPVTA